MRKIFCKKIIMIPICAALVIIGSVVLILNFNQNKSDSKANKENYKECHVNFDVNGGTQVEEITLRCGTKIESTIKDPVKDGFEFSGWTYLGMPYDFEQIINEDITLSANYNILEGTKIVIVSFDTDGGTSINPIDVKVGGIITKPKNPTKYGYKFQGWYLNKELFNFKDPINSNVKLKAKWEKDSSKNESVFNDVSTNSNYKCMATYSNNVETKEVYTGSGFNIDYLFSTKLSYSTDDCSVNYKTSDSSIAFMSNNGDIRTLKSGKVTIYECIDDKETKKEIGCFKGILVIKDKEQNTSSSESSQSSNNTTTPNANSNPNKISLSTHNMEIDVGQEKEFTISYEPSNISEHAISCYINNDNARLKSYVTGTYTRTIVGMKEGTSTITCYNDNNGTANRVKDTINVVVKYNKVQGISFNNIGDSYEANIGFGNICPQYTISPSNATNKNVILTSSNPSVVSISKNCIKTLSEGTSTITITTEEGHFTDSFVVNVHYVSPTDMHIYGCPLNAKVGENIKLTHKISPGQVTNPSVTWISLNENIATVDQKGNVVIVGRPTPTATAHIRVISNANENIRATCSIGIYDE